LVVIAGMVGNLGPFAPRRPTHPDPQGRPLRLRPLSAASRVDSAT
jgi:hypothetical protein